MSAASVEARVALGPTSGQSLTRRGRKRDRRPHFLPGERCCDLEGFSLHAKVAIEGHDRAGLERLCRTIARPAIASERLSIDPDGRVVYRLRRRALPERRDGTSAIVFEPQAFLERLAALVPGPRTHLLTYHGVLAPATQWRDKIVPGPRTPTESDHGSTEPRAKACSNPPDSPAALSNPARARRLRWAELLRRVLAVDVLTRPHCGGARRLIATITDGLVVRRILGPPRAARLPAVDRPGHSASRSRVRPVGDPREHIDSLEKVERAETHDELWN
ncbi:MAG: transposase [Planctomycetota bacterium]|nr:transposase [Planctomycetota bacterium]